MLEAIFAGAMLVFFFIGAFNAVLFCGFALIFVLYPLTTIGVLLLMGVVYYFFERKLKDGFNKLNPPGCDDDQSP